MTITEFLEARIADDERHAHKLAETDRRPILSIAMTVNHPERFLAECAAKRSIIAEHGRDEHSTADYCETCAAWWQYEVGEGAPPVVWPCPTLRAITAVYADHPDYQQEWK